MKRKVDLTFMKKNYHVRTKSRLGFCKKKMWFGYRDMMKNYGVETKSRLGICRKNVGFCYRDIMKNHWVKTKSSFDFHKEKLWG